MLVCGLIGLIEQIDRLSANQNEVIKVNFSAI